MKNIYIIKSAKKLLAKGCMKFKELRELDSMLNMDKDEAFVGHYILNMKLTNAKNLIEQKKDYSWNDLDSLTDLIKEIDEIMGTRIIRKHISMMDPKDLTITIPPPEPAAE